MNDTLIDCSGTLNSVSIVLLACVNAISGTIAVIGNILVLLAVHQTPALQSVSNYLICSLATSDLLAGLIVNPLLIAKTVFNITTGGALATVAEVAALLVITSTCLSLCSISIDRYIAVIYVFRYHKIMTNKRCLILVLFNWVFSLLYSCSRFLITSDKYLPVLWIVSCMVNFVVPFTIIAYCYYFIFKQAQAAKRRIVAENTIANPQVIEATQNRKAAWTIAIVIGVFVLFLAPNLVVSIIQNSVEDPCQVRRMYKLWFWFSFVTFCSSAVNPWIYAIRNKELRVAFLRILRLLKRSDVPQTSSDEATP